MSSIKASKFKILNTLTFEYSVQMWENKMFNQIK